MSRVRRRHDTGCPKRRPLSTGRGGVLLARHAAGLESREARMSETPGAGVSPSDKVKQFPTAPGLYLMKDAQGRVIYIGKAKNLRSRASSYFHKGATDDRRICDWIDEVADVDFLPADSEVDALL